MTRTWRRRPGRRATATLLATAVATTGIVYAGFRLDDDGPPHEGAGRGPKTVTEAAALRQAVRTGKKVEVTSARTTNSTTWARPDRLMEKRLYSSPVRAKVEGEWKSIDPSLHRTKEGWEPRATNTRMVFSAGSGQHGAQSSTARASRSGVQRVSLVKSAAADSGTPLVTLYVDGGAHTIQLTWPGAVPTPVVDGNRILYPEVFPGGDLVLTADDDGFGQVVVVKNRQAAADPHVQQLLYGLHSADLTFRLDPLTGVVSALDSDGAEVALSPTPLMWDSSGAPAVTDGSVGASAQPTVSESPNPTPTVTSASPSASSSASEGDLPSDEQVDPNAEVLPSATDEPSPVPTPALPSAPAEPTPEPSQTGSSATLSLPSLNGPAPDSRGELVKADLSAGQWTLTPDQDFLNDPATTYPVFIDPAVKKHVQNWTTAYDRHPNATFYNGKDFNKGGTHEARVGFESDTWGTSRSFFNIDFDKDLKGTKLTSATLYMLETYAWSCQDRSISVHLTGAVNGHTNWKNAPKLHDGNKLTTKSFAHGYKSGCRDAFEKFDVRSGAQKAADKGQASITFGLRARDEDAQYAWKKFEANGNNPPYLELVYNRAPAIVANSLRMNTNLKCTTSQPYATVGPGNLTFTAKATDEDNNLDYFNFDLWRTGKWSTTGDLLNTTGKVSVGPDRSTALKTTNNFSTSSLTNGATYSWRVLAMDDAGSTTGWYPKEVCQFILDADAPQSPEVESTDYPDADGDSNGFGVGDEDTKWSTKKFGTPGSFTFRALDTDVVRYEYGFNSASYTGSLARTNGAATTVKATITNAQPPAAGPNVLYVRAVDSVGNVSQPTKYFFYVTPRDQADKAGDFTGDGLPDMMVVTNAGTLAMYPSQSEADLTKGSGDLDYSMTGAYQANPAKDPNGDDMPPYVAAPRGHFNGALITHNGDIYGGDGLQDLVARIGDKLWVYPGDGYGAVNIDKRQQILLPAGAPSPAAFTQLVAAGDITGDGRTDFLVLAGEQLWALTGYHGATIDQATLLLTSSTWTTRDLVTVMDVTGDGIADLVYRSDSSARLLLRTGVAASTGGVNLSSLASAANSQGGADTVYGSSGWSRASIPKLMGTPDANGDTIPDIWTVRTDGSVRLYTGSKTALSGSGSEIIGANTNWTTRIAIG
ncbi:DNRLRE domain-containing protein [Streptomyces griseoruber]|uniref:DNRLRE domain-containing protein n=1 Tax=Streptomyces griseoruber TaxID=1943 RepID=UPI0006E3C90F|nr:DNRLRE domain-containing protein [Streptomyces griseoruber]